MFYSKVDIIILNWNGKEDSIECIESLKHVTYPNFKIILVDNGSTDGSAPYFREWYPEIEIIENGTNLGFTGGNNIAIKKAMNDGADYILLLNNDVIVESDFLDKLIIAANSNDNIGIAGPKIKYYDSPEILWSAGGYINYWLGLIAYFGIKKKDNEKYNSIKYVDYISGCVTLIDVEIFKNVGFFDNRYFSYFEDVDFSQRVKNKGYALLYVPTSVIYHKVSITSGGSLSHFSLYYNTRNKLLFLFQHSKKYHLILSIPITLTVFTVRCLFLLLIKRDAEGIRRICDGIKDFINGKFGEKIEIKIS